MTGKDIKALRTRLLLFQEEFAKEIGVNICTVRWWEQGRMNISIKNQRKILEYCKRKGIDL